MTRQQPIPRYPTIFIPDGSLDVWRAAKANAGAAPAGLMAIGDSITAGQITTDQWTNSWFRILRAALVAQIGDYAEGYGGIMSNGFSNTWVGNAPIQLSGTHAAGTQSNRGFGATVDQVDTLGSFTLGPKGACTAMDLLFFDGTGTWQFTVDPAGSGSFSYQVPGGGPTGGTANVAVTVTNAGTSLVRRVALTGLSNTTHTVLCSNGSIAEALQFAGFTAYSGSAGGLCSWWNGHPGADSVTWNSTAQYQLMGGRGGVNQWAGFPVGSHLTILSMGINDMQIGNIDPSSFEGIWRTHIRAIRRARPNASIVLLLPYSADTLTSDLTSSAWTNARQWYLYVNRAYRLAQDLNCAVVNIHARWIDQPVANGYLTAGNNHPNAGGHADIAAQLGSIL